MFIDRAVIEINGGCNYTCQMCPQTTPDGKTGARGKNWLKKMPLSQFEDIVAEISEKGLRIVNLEGSGEPTLNNDLPKYIEIVKKYNAKAYIFSNGMRMKDQFMKDCVDAGLDFFRFSIIGYDEETYRKWMNSPFFNLVIKNMKKMDEHAKNCTVAKYHLILDNNNIEYEKERYLSLSEGTNVKTEIWKMHNWSGVYDLKDGRKGERKSCGRPFYPDIVVRAGGLNGATGAVHPCCQVLGRDDEAVLGHMSEQSLEEIWHGDLYNNLRKGHEIEEYPSYCEGCDFLIDDPEVLVYTDHDTKIHQMHGTAEPIRVI